MLPKLISKSNTLKPKEHSEEIVKALGITSDGYQAGLTKIFLRAGLLARFEKMRGDIMSASALKIQRVFRGYVMKRVFAAIKEHSIFLQSVIRMIICQHMATHKRHNNASIKIQKTWRMWSVRNEYCIRKEYSIFVQSGINMFFTTSQFFSD